MSSLSELDWAIVFKVATEHTQDFREFAREVERWRRQGEPDDAAPE